MFDFSSNVQSVGFFLHSMGVLALHARMKKALHFSQVLALKWIPVAGVLHSWHFEFFSNSFFFFIRTIGIKNLENRIKIEKFNFDDSILDCIQSTSQIFILISTKPRLFVKICVGLYSNKLIL